MGIPSLRLSLWLCGSIYQREIIGNPRPRMGRPGARVADMTLNLAIPPRVTDRAFARLAEIAEDTGTARALRVAVSGGGCSGFQYDIRLDDPAEDDLVLEKDGCKVCVDSVSLPFLADAVIDFSEELIGARFVVQNPNASSSCGCGISFSM
jgi:iron-sulfur cluster assembly accessory protein